MAFTPAVGHRALKLKVGFGTETDLVNLADLRRVVGDGMLAADANQGWSIDQALALRGLAQSMARELSPHGIHVGHFVIDGGIRSAARAEPEDRPDSMLDPDAIALSYWNVLQQPRSAWTWEVEVRPWVEKF
jgi:Enolase C-terminal domain-like